jgi:hypothetical protein
LVLGARWQVRSCLVLGARCYVRRARARARASCSCGCMCLVQRASARCGVPVLGVPVLGVPVLGARCSVLRAPCLVLGASGVWFLKRAGACDVAETAIPIRPIRAIAGLFGWNGTCQ